MLYLPSVVVYSGRLDLVICLLGCRQSICDFIIILFYFFIVRSLYLEHISYGTSDCLT